MLTCNQTCTGRVVSTTPTHLQAITTLSVSPTSTHLLTGSTDSTVHVWSIPSLLSFSAFSESRSPIHTLSAHRAPITALAIGRIPGPGAIAITVAEDGTSRVWDYTRGELLRTFLLREGAIPRCLAVDPADRGFFVGYDDGSVQLVDFFSTSGVSMESHELNGVPEPSRRGPISSLHERDAASTPIQLSRSSMLLSGSPAGSVLSLTLRFDGTSILSGHENGSVMEWDIGGRKWTETIINLPGPVTNLKIQTSSPLDQQVGKRGFKIDKVVKPKFDAATKSPADGEVPGNYTFNTQFVKDLYCLSSTTGHDFVQRGSKRKRRSAFEEAFDCPSGLPQQFLEESLAELNAWKHSAQSQSSYITVSGASANDATAAVPSDETTDFMALDAVADADASVKKGKSKGKGPDLPHLSLQQQNERLQQKIEALQRVQRVTFSQLEDLRIERERYLGRDSVSAADNKRATDGLEQHATKQNAKQSGVDGRIKELEIDQQGAEDLTASAKEFVEQEEEDESEEQSTSPEIRIDDELDDQDSDTG